MNIHDDAGAGRLASVTAHLAAGGDVDARDTLERTPLHVAAENARADFVAVLLAHKAQVDARDYRGNTPLHHAAGMGSAGSVRLLLDAGADATVTNTFHATPLHALASGGASAPAKERCDIVDRLLAAGAVIDALDTSDRTPLWFAAATRTTPTPPKMQAARLDVLKRLLEKGADPKHKAAGQMGTPRDAARGMHQAKRFRLAWPEAVALLDNGDGGS